MRLALIPPKGCERAALLSDYHLVLPLQCVRPAYLRTYLTARESDHYIILDNGAAEGHLTLLPDLLRLGATLRCAEIILPDVLMNMHETLSYARGAADSIRKLQEGGEPAMFGVWAEDVCFTGVVQGENEKEFDDCLKAYVDMEWIDRIAVPRHMSTRLGATARTTYMLRNAEVLQSRFGMVHCLGSSNAAWNEVALLEEIPFVKGLDTSLIFGTSLQGINISDPEAAENYVIPHDYWTRNWSNEFDFARELFVRNLNLYGAWAGNARLAQTSPSEVRAVPLEGGE